MRAIAVPMLGGRSGSRGHGIYLFPATMQCGSSNSQPSLPPLWQGEVGNILHAHGSIHADVQWFALSSHGGSHDVNTGIIALVQIQQVHRGLDMNAA